MDGIERIFGYFSYKFERIREGKSELFRTKRDKDIFDVSIYLTLSLSLSTHAT